MRDRITVQQRSSVQDELAIMLRPYLVLEY